MDLSFILLKSATPPDADAIVRAANEHGIDLQRNEPAPDKEGALAFSADGLELIVMYVAAPHPDAVNMPTGPTAPSAEELAASPAHLIVALTGLEGEPRERDATAALFTSLVIAGSDALGAVLAHGNYFHRAEIFADLSELGVERSCIPAEITISLSFAPEASDRMSVLTHGLDRYGREEFLIGCPVNGKGALDLTFMLSNWMLLDAAKQLPTGDTVGRDEGERLVVQRVPSPIEGNADVIRLDLP